MGAASQHQRLARNLLGAFEELRPGRGSAGKLTRLANPMVSGAAKLDHGVSRTLSQIAK
jgi:hypothetical protein